MIASGFANSLQYALYGYAYLLACAHDVFVQQHTGTGSIVVRTDLNGMVYWQDTVAFKAQGNPDGSATTISPNTWTKIELNALTSYNLGLHYQAAASHFAAPVSGAYHFTGHASFANRRSWTGIGLGGSRKGVALALPYQFHQNGTVTLTSTGITYTACNANVMNMSADVKLQTGDIVWLMVCCTDSNEKVLADGPKTWFTGRLVTVL